ncbi:MAG: hypothetical protein WCH99_10610 [Verrucomicrobiota bacterium]
MNRTFTVLWLTISWMLCAVFVAQANPIPFLNSELAPVYIASEKLVVTLAPEAAVMTGTFTFQSKDSATNPPEFPARTWLPIWLPETDQADAATKSFWETFGTNLLNQVKTNHLETMRQIIGLKATLGGKPIETVDFFGLYHGINLDRLLNRNIFALGKERKSALLLLRKYLDPEFCCLVFPIVSDQELTQKKLPLVVQYRQPLAVSGKERKFYYVPAFKDLPENISTLDTSSYSITLTVATNCQAQVSVNRDHYELRPGKSLTLSLSHLTAIRATVNADGGGRH